MKKVIILAASLVFVLGILTACGGSSTDESATTEPTTEKATVTAGEAAEKEATKEATKATEKVKTGTEDPAIDTAKAYAKEHIKGFDGNWENLELEVDDPTTIIDFDYGGKHYSYTFDQESGKITD